MLAPVCPCMLAVTSPASDTMKGDVLVGLGGRVEKEVLRHEQGAQVSYLASVYLAPPAFEVSYVPNTVACILHTSDLQPAWVGT
jgi:hypothetical protein